MIHGQMNAILAWVTILAMFVVTFVAGWWARSHWYDQQT